MADVGEASVVRIVETPDDGELIVVSEAAEGQVRFVALARTHASVGRTEEALLLPCLDGEVDDGLFIAIGEA